MRRRSTPAKKQAERDFPVKIDFPVPPNGLGSVLNEMHDWLNINVGKGKWECHGRLEGNQDFARFYFKNDFGANAFRRKFMPDDE